MRTFTFYFKKGFALTKHTLKGKSFFNKLLLGLYLIASFVGKLFLFTRPIFLIGDNNLAMMIVEGQDFEINKVFEGVNSKKRYSSLLLSCLFIEAITVGVAALLIAPFVIWQSNFTSYDPAFQPIIIAYVMIAVVVALFVALAVTYAPSGFVTVKGKDLNSGDILYLAKEGSKGIKGRIVGLNVVFTLFILLVDAVFTAVPIILVNIQGGQPSIVYTIIIAVMMLAYVVLDIFLLAVFRLGRNIACYSLYFDSVETKHIVVASRGNSSNEYVPLFVDDKEEK